MPRGEPSLPRSCLGILLASYMLIACSQTRVELPPTPSSTRAGAILYAFPEQITTDRRYMIFIHGRIIEDEGTNAVSPQFGPYQFEAILERLAASGFDVIGEVRSGPTDGYAYADHVADQVRSLIAHGVPSQHITVAGFSKGAGIVILASARLKHPDVNYVLMGICGEETNSATAPTLTGRVLSVYEKSDALGSSCRPLAERSPALTSFAEIELSTGKQHGVFYSADPVWLEPVVAWAWAVEP